MIESRPTIGIDLDDVLLVCLPKIVEYHNRMHGTSVTAITTYDLEVLFGISVPVKNDRVHAFYLSDDHGRMSPVEGAQGAMRRLKETHRLHIITARGEVIRRRTEELILRYFPDTFEDMHFIGYHITPSGKRPSKSEVCRKIGARVFVDDALHHAADVAESGCKVFLPDQPWNQCGALPPRVTRVFSWEEIVRRIEAGA